MGGLYAVANALNDGKLAQAQVAAVFLKLAPLDREGAQRLWQVERALAKYDSNEPRDWRGRWTDGMDSSATPSMQYPALRATPVQEVMPFPPEQILPLEPEFPIPAFPEDILPPLTGAPDSIAPRGRVQNLYPDDPDCAQKWDNADRYCRDLLRNGLAGKGNYKNFGQTYCSALGAW